MRFILVADVIYNLDDISTIENSVDDNTVDITFKHLTFEEKINADNYPFERFIKAMEILCNGEASFVKINSLVDNTTDDITIIAS